MFSLIIWKVPSDYSFINTYPPFFFMMPSLFSCVHHVIIWKVPLYAALTVLLCSTCHNLESFVWLFLLLTSSLILPAFPYCSLVIECWKCCSIVFLDICYEPNCSFVGRDTVRVQRTTQPWFFDYYLRPIFSWFSRCPDVAKSLIWDWWIVAKNLLFLLLNVENVPLLSICIKSLQKCSNGVWLFPQIN